RENVGFHSTREAAERAGFRPCKRCQPDQPPLAERQAAEVAELCRWMEASNEVPSLADLAKHVGWSTFHTHRTFKAVTGLTPRAWADGRRAERVRTELGRPGNVTQAMYEAGYNSSGRFYEKTNQILGMTPSKYRDGGKDLEIRFAIGESSL